MTLSDRLRSERKKAGLSQVQFAEKLGLNARTYASYERGERDISTALLLDICKALNISSDRLLGNPTEPQEDKKEALPPDEERWKRNRDKVDGLPDETKERLMEQIEALIDIEVHRGQ